LSFIRDNEFITCNLDITLNGYYINNPSYLGSECMGNMFKVIGTVVIRVWLDVMGEINDGWDVIVILDLFDEQVEDRGSETADFWVKGIDIGNFSVDCDVIDSLSLFDGTVVGDTRFGICCKWNTRLVWGTVISSISENTMGGINWSVSCLIFCTVPSGPDGGDIVANKPQHITSASIWHTVSLRSSCLLEKKLRTFKLKSSFRIVNSSRAFPIDHDLSCLSLIPLGAPNILPLSLESISKMEGNNGLLCNTIAK